MKVTYQIPGGPFGTVEGPEQAVRAFFASQPNFHSELTQNTAPSTPEPLIAPKMFLENATPTQRPPIPMFGTGTTMLVTNVEPLLIPQMDFGGENGAENRVLSQNGSQAVPGHGHALNAIPGADKPLVAPQMTF